MVRKPGWYNFQSWGDCFRYHRGKGEDLGHCAWMADLWESVRTLKNLPVEVIESLAKAAPTQSRRYVREILCRITIEDQTIKSAEISSHAQDAMAVKERLFSTLGRLVYGYYDSLDPMVRVGYANNAMTKEERRVFLNALLEPIDESQEKEEPNDE